jgi:predicted nucleic acid-binding protein
MIVVDTNILAYFLIRGEYSEVVDRLYEVDPDWIAPRLWLDEFLNVLATSERNEKLSAAEADAILADVTELMSDSSYDVPAYRILSTARISGCTAYDSQYLALAQDLGLQLYTFDQKLIARSDGLAVRPE